MHPMRLAVSTTAEPDDRAPERREWIKDFTIGWLAGLIFFGTMLG